MALPSRADMSDALQIYQDSTYFSQPAPIISHAPMPSPSKPPQRRLLQSVPNTMHRSTSSIGASISNSNITIKPPVLPAAAQQSPRKMASAISTSPLSPLRSSQPQKLNIVSFKPITTSLSDLGQTKQPPMSRFKTMAHKPAADAMSSSPVVFAGKENGHAVIFPAPPAMNLSIENYYQKPQGKRLLEPAPIKDGRPLKRVRVDDGPLPPPDSFAPILDDGQKPGHSYAMLIGMAILRSKTRKLTLAQIYKWISDTYSFYSPQDAGWQNSIRHNLSLNKAFVKKERPKDDPGKGNYWAIESGMEHLFMKDKPTRKPTGSGDNLQVMSTSVLEPSLPTMPLPFQEPALPPQLPPMPMSTTDSSFGASAVSNPPVKQQPELSSDATILASDSETPEDAAATSEGSGLATSASATANGISTDALSSALLEPTDPLTVSLDSSYYSPVPAAALHSSPPIARHIEATSGTPPPAPRLSLDSSVGRTRKRKAASMDDSGYISSLESSALRSNQNTRHLPSEGDRSHRIKRGRAEEEIARLRASSYDSPTKNRSRNGFHPPSSSPLRHGRNDPASGQMPPPPLTPAVKLKAPPKPPPSVSPGTNLRMHRDKVRHLLASPLRRIASASDEITTWGSPNAFDESLYNFTDETEFTLDTTSLGNGFEIFQDDSLSNFFPGLHNGSPVKMPASKRMRLDRSQSVSALLEVTNSATRRSITSAPLLKAPVQSPGLIDTPSKFFDNLPSSPSKLFNQSPTKMPASAMNGAGIDSLGPALGDENSWIQLGEMYAPDLFQDADEYNGLDILQGFEKIGANVSTPPPLFNMPQQPPMASYQQSQQQPQQRGPSRVSQKSGLGRSYTSTF